MDLVYILDYRFARTPDGVVWTDTDYAESFWGRYLNTFDRVRVVSRVREAPSAKPAWKRVEGESVSVEAVPYYLGPFEYLARARKIRRTLQAALTPDAAVILRAPSQLSTCCASLLRSSGHPYGLEVVGDPRRSFARGSTRHFLRPIFRWWYPLQQKNQCANACAVAYVSGTLRERYPERGSALSTICSDVYLPARAFVDHARGHRWKKTFHIVTVGTLSQLYKGIDILMEAAAACVRSGLDLTLTIVGDGKHRAEFESRAAALNLGSKIEFLGHVPAGEPVRAQLDRADLFVLASRTEGLPRALLEAMARALPCVGSAVGGIPEFLSSDDLAPPGDAGSLASKICEVAADPDRMDRMSRRNLEMARGYRDDLLQQRREEFYQFLRHKTDEWTGAQSLSPAGRSLRNYAGSSRH